VYDLLEAGIQGAVGTMVLGRLGREQVEGKEAIVELLAISFRDPQTAGYLLP
jgi:hypothetical protein